MTHNARCSRVQTVKDCCNDYQNLTSLTVHEQVAENGALINNHLSSLFLMTLGDKLVLLYIDLSVLYPFQKFVQQLLNEGEYALKNREEKCDVTLPWQHYFWMTTTTATARRTTKNMFILTNNNFARAHAILYISLPSLHHYDMKLINFTSPLYGVGENNKKIVPFIF